MTIRAYASGSVVAFINDEKMVPEYAMQCKDRVHATAVALVFNEPDKWSLKIFTDHMEEWLASLPVVSVVEVPTKE